MGLAERLAFFIELNLNNEIKDCFFNPRSSVCFDAE